MTDIVTPPTIDPLPPPPQQTDTPAEFDAKSYATLQAQVQLVGQVNASAAATQQNATATHELAQAAAQTLADTQQVKTQALAQTQAIADQAVADTNAIADQAVADTNAIKNAAAQSASQAADSAAAAQAVANFVGPWSELSGAVAKGSTTYHAGRFWVSLQAIPSASAAEPGVSPAWAKTGGGIDSLAYDSRAQLRGRAGASGDLVLIDGLGLFRFAEGSDEPDDDESCFATTSGRWLLMCPSWDVVNDWQLPDDDARDAWDEDEPARFASSFASRVLHGTATCAIASLTATTSVTFTGAVTGAAVGDRVLATPPAQMGSTAADTARLSCHAYVSAANTVTVVLCNASAAAATVNPAVQAAWPVTVIKGA